MCLGCEIRSRPAGLHQGCPDRRVAGGSPDRREGVGGGGFPRQRWGTGSPDRPGGAGSPDRPGGGRIPRDRLPRQMGGSGSPDRARLGAGSPNRWGRRAPWTAQVQVVIRVPRPRQRASCGGKPTRDIPGKPDVSHPRGSPLCPVSTAVKRGFGDANSSDLAFLPCCCCCC